MMPFGENLGELAGQEMVLARLSRAEIDHPVQPAGIGVGWLGGFVKRLRSEKKAALPAIEGQADRRPQRSPRRPA